MIEITKLHLFQLEFLVITACYSWLDNPVVTDSMWDTLSKSMAGKIEGLIPDFNFSTDLWLNDLPEELKDLILYCAKKASPNFNHVELASVLGVELPDVWEDVYIDYRQVEVGV